MKKNLLSILLLILSFIFAILVYYEYTGKIEFAMVYLSGFIGGMSIALIKLNMKNAKLNMYKRELEKEAIASDEHSAKVKVLESKIKVLEKALENSLKNN